MKAFMLSIGYIFLVSTSFAHLVQNETIECRLRTFQLDNGEAKYLKYEKKAGIINIYNPDHSVWKSVKLPLPKGHLLDEIKLISTSTYNEDEYITFTLNINNENGKALLKEKHSNDYEILESNARKKLLVYKHLSKGFTSKSQTVVYSIPQ